MPVGLVVKKGVKTRSTSESKPVPESLTATSTSPDLSYPGLHPDETRSICYRDQGFNAVHNQVQQYLLQLNAISQHKRELGCQLAVNQDSMFIQLAASQDEHVLNYFIDVQWISLCRFFLYEMLGSELRLHLHEYHRQ